MTGLKPLRVGLVSNVPEVVIAARSALAGFAEVTGASLEHPTLTCLVDVGRFSSCLRHVDGTSTRLRVLDSPRSETGIVIYRGDRNRTLVIPAAGASAQAIVFRELRKMLAGQLIADGWLPLHAAAVVTADGSVLLLMGPKMAGKTTTLLSLLRAGACRLAANDKIFVRGSALGLEAQTLPVAAGIRGAAMPMFPELDALWANRELLHIDNVGLNGNQATSRMYVPLRALAAAFGTSVSPGGPVGAAIAVKFSLDAVRTTLEPLDIAAAREIFQRDLEAGSLVWQEELVGSHLPDARQNAAEAFAATAGYRLTTAPGPVRLDIGGLFPQSSLRLNSKCKVLP